jgi:hypothetical protein
MAENEQLRRCKIRENYSITNSPDIRACSCEYNGKPFRANGDGFYEKNS